MGEEYTELWELSLQPLCKYKIIPKLKLHLKKKKVAVNTNELRDVDPGSLLVATALTPTAHP